MSRTQENRMLQKATANGSFLSLSKTPLSEDFYTDSLLDASKIPSPSPKKQPFAHAAKGRRVLGNSKTLRDAWNATTNRGLPAERDGGRSTTPLNPLTTPLQGRNPGTVPNDRKVTPSPSPHRRPLDVTTSPSDVSSPPPRGLTDVYQRIAEEENLAAQEGQIDEEDQDTDEIMPEGASVTGELPRNGTTASGPPFSRSNHDRIPHGVENEDDKENIDLEDITSMSDPSGMSFLQGLTDQGLAAKLTPHMFDRAGDRDRIERELENDRLIAFRYGSRAKLGLTKENLLKHGSPEYSSMRRGSSSGSVRTEPPANVPRNWGTKSKAGREWLKSRRENGGGGIKSSPGPDSSQVDWAGAAADIALPSVEDSSTPRFGGEKPPPASLERQTSLDKIRQWELNDFTGQSFQVSQSPPVRIRTNAQDQMRDREIESLERQAVTTNRLDEIRQRDSREQLRKLHSTSTGRSEEDHIEIAFPALEKSGSKSGDPDGEAIPDTPIVIYRSSSSGSRSENTDFEVNPRKDNNAEKSYEHLRRLARSMSNSPRASPSPDGEVLAKPATLIDEIDRLQSKEEASRKSSKEVVDATSTPHGTRLAGNSRTPVVTGAWTDTILPDTVRPSKEQEERSARYAQTPQVTAGGWIETPATSRRYISTLAPIPLEEVPEELIDILPQVGTTTQGQSPSEAITNMPQPESEVQKGALANLLARAKRRLISEDITSAVRENNDTLNLGEATLESLEGLLTLDATEMSTLIRLGAETEAQELLNSANHPTDPEAEADLLERLSTKLERLRSNIHDARKGISKLEDQVSRSPGSVTTTIMKIEPPTGSCERCGHPYLTSPTSVPHNLYVSVPVPHLFHTRRTDLGHWLPRPTRLGWMVLVIWLWYVLECAMAELFSHPVYADWYEWPIEREPRFPFVLPVMFGRWTGLNRFNSFAGTGSHVLRPLWTITVALFRILGQALGWTDGFIDDQPIPTLARAAAPLGGDMDLSMMSDELL